jgi:predicted ribosome quality control (RQC) complex YloA/Tae2 family protein
MIVENYKDIFFKLGKNAKENQLLIDTSDSNFWWFHLDDYPSGHCVIESNAINKEMRYFAANLIKQNIKYKNKRLKIVYTQIKNLKNTKTIGEVITSNTLYFTI